jgi:hypothetical protein
VISDTRSSHATADNDNLRLCWKFGHDDVLLV